MFAAVRGVLWTCPKRSLDCHGPVIDKWEHEQSFLDDLSELIMLGDQVAVVVIWHHHSSVLRSELHNVAVVVADDAFAGDASRGSEHDHFVTLQRRQDLLIWNTQY